MLLCRLIEAEVEFGSDALVYDETVDSSQRSTKRRIEMFKDYEFAYRNHTCAVKSSGVGHLCGYVTSNENHPLFIECYTNGHDYPDVICHGGVTYQSGPIIGFDCGHCGDSQSLEYMNEEMYRYYTEKRPERLDDDGRVWTPTEVEAECKHMVDELIARRLYTSLDFKYVLRTLWDMLKWNFKTLWKDTY